MISLDLGGACCTACIALSRMRFVCTRIGVEGSRDGTQNLLTHSHCLTSFVAQQDFRSSSRHLKNTTHERHSETTHDFFKGIEQGIDTLVENNTSDHLFSPCKNTTHECFEGVEPRIDFLMKQDFRSSCTSIFQNTTHKSFTELEPRMDFLEGNKISDRHVFRYLKIQLISPARDSVTLDFLVVQEDFNRIEQGIDFFWLTRLPIVACPRPNFQPMRPSRDIPTRIDFFVRPLDFQSMYQRHSRLVSPSRYSNSEFRFW